MAIKLAHPDASIHVEDAPARRIVDVTPITNVFVAAPRWTTSYPLDLIEHVLRVKGPGRLCDEIMRDEDPRYIQQSFHWGILGYLDPADIDGRRILDFGSGCGASTMVLGRMFPHARIVGVELVEPFVELARHRARHYGMADRVEFQLSPDADSLPAGLGQFDFIVFSAVYEHLLPHERRAVLPMLWTHLKPGGVLFLDQTPYRWAPVESHTTGLPLINYLPDRLALHAARRFSKRVNPDTGWDELLRRGIRGGTTREVLSDLARADGRAELLEPGRLGLRDRIDLWHRLSSGHRHARLKAWIKRGLRAIRVLTGVTAVPQLSLAIRKHA